jgi:hypothetical protein
MSAIQKSAAQSDLLHDRGDGGWPVLPGTIAAERGPTLLAIGRGLPDGTPHPEYAVVPEGPLGPCLPERQERLTLTPEQCRWLLDNCNFNNRNVVKSDIDKLCSTLRRGHWKYNAQTVILSWRGRLLNGQHRLMASVITGIPIEVLVVFGMDEDAYESMDVGPSRGHKDFLGNRQEINCSTLSAAIKYVYQYMEGVRNDGIRRCNVDNYELREFFDQHPGLRETVKFAKNHHKHIGVAPSIVAAFYYLFRRANWEMADQFFDTLQSGLGLTEGSPVAALRNRLFQTAIQDGKWGRLGPAKEPEFGAKQLFIRAWNHFRMGKTIKNIVVTYAIKGNKIVLDPLPEIL